MFDFIDFNYVTSVKLFKDIDLSEFDCSLRDTLGLNEFLHKEAIEYQENNLGVTYLFYYEEFIIGYVTVAMSRLRGRLVPTEEDEKSIRWYPALLIGRLAVHNCCRGLDIGSYICEWCVGYAQTLAEDIGCKFVYADTDDTVRGFYEKCGFVCIKEVDNIVAFRRI